MEGRHVHGERVRELRLQAGYKRPEFADLARISVTYLKQIEGIYSAPGEPTTQPRIEIVYRIAHALDVGIDAFTTPVDGANGNAA